MNNILYLAQSLDRPKRSGRSIHEPPVGSLESDRLHLPGTSDELLAAVPNPDNSSDILPDQFERLLDLAAVIAKVVPPKPEPKYLTAQDAATYLRTTVQGIYALVKRGRVAPMPGSGKLLFTRETLDKYLNGKFRR